MTKTIPPTHLSAETGTPAVVKHAVAVVAAVLLLDWGSKWLVHLYLPQGQAWPVWPGIFHFTATQNTGMAFGMLAQSPQLVMVISGLVWLSGLYFLWRHSKSLMAPLTPVLARIGGWSTAGVIGGALANWTERLLHGYVTDFLDVTVIHFPVFNVADVAVCVGVAGLCWVVWHYPGHPSAAQHPLERADGHGP